MRHVGTTTMAAEFADSDVEKQRSKTAEDGGGILNNSAADQSHELVEVVVVKAEPQLERNSSSHEECRCKSSTLFKNATQAVKDIPTHSKAVYACFISHRNNVMAVFSLFWVCQEENEEVLINLGCQCRGGLAKAHRTCIIKWFNTRGSNKCEICQQIAVNVSPPDSQASICTVYFWIQAFNMHTQLGLQDFETVSGQRLSENDQDFSGMSSPDHVLTSYWIWRVDPALRAQERERGCFSPLWVAFSILIGGLLLDVLISVTLGVSALPVNIIIGVIVVLGLGTALRLALEFCQDWNVRRVVQRVEANANLVYHPAL
ncbi:hypothetical protein BUALT_Bualt05G0093200 [Buddleja alternifolia]|uniref:RING-CH-type domain-containing protein n=1 Tax=Buddleja alternifolia TaxID=168488 RepID=A0AAV6XJS3_9LAMI|nr:hypothetical protein BUALT_Bualt05G0093200 [Buddleja alternifolia]